VVWNPLEKAKSSSSFCILPWVHQYIGPRGDVKPCCIYNPMDELGSLKETTLETIFNSDKSKQLRLDMLNDVEIPNCKECNLREGIVRGTYRQQSNKIYLSNTHPSYQSIIDQLNSTTVDGAVPKHQLHYLDCRWNNLCNFKCMTCNPTFSSSFISEYEDIYNVKHAYTFSGKTEEDAFEQIVSHVPTLDSIYFAGGEPMMQKQHYMLLEECIKANRFPNLMYNTNLSRLSLGNYDVIELWKNFDEVSVMASLDASYERAEYWRKGTIWADIVANRKRIKDQAPNVNFVVSCTVTWPNIYNILEFHKEWYNLGLVSLVNFTTNPIFSPTIYSLNNLPGWKKEHIISAIEEHIEWIKTRNDIPIAIETSVKSFTGLIKFINRPGTEFECERFHQTVTAIDAYRKTNFFDVFTEHRDIEKWLNTKGYIFEKNTPL